MPPVEGLKLNELQVVNLTYGSLPVYQPDMICTILYLYMDHLAAVMRVLNLRDQEGTLSCQYE
eukprot:CAMPEP_0197862616 /NCGR_PEP_ID=MMETSP1438-20131217/39520_1 /TAXON_ID=1461541 /ORGANISM="Pterosperma sp., Strain CCMP1384" /LENGTH=62 /DNA_ID=CAMNT_0043480235 /DNA_START=56 /DNA_END=244 /DNA_ORIENTATION=-